MHNKKLTEKDLKSLRVFTSVAEAGGFTIAEKKLNMSKASISRHIREIEEKLGVQLCERGPSGFKLTESGLFVIEKANTALKALDNIKTEVDERHGILSGTLVIGVIEHILTDPLCHLSATIAQFTQEAPNVKLELSILNHNQLNKALSDRTIQIGIRGQYHENSRFNYQFLFIENHKLYVSANTANNKHNLALVYRPHPFTESILASGEFSRGPEAAGLEAVATFIASGHYVGILPEDYASHINFRHSLIEMSDSPVFHNRICAITEASKPLTQSEALFLKLLSQLSKAPVST
ncbi:LysR family transcriptional regulator [Providencia huaxiensis]|uniref:LysR family transcriptional regulator n=1 Tax=Providencia TaxID=586 RepID=UPI00234A373A|nr:LysR family transcriptional regulator [Providencia sp. PROV076]